MEGIMHLTNQPRRSCRPSSIWGAGIVFWTMPGTIRIKRGGRAGRNCGTHDWEVVALLHRPPS
jgi:hypothetical protein